MRPCATNNIPSVWINAGTPARVTMNPLIAPITAPSARPPRIPAHTGQPMLVINFPDETATNPATAPTDKSKTPLIKRKA